MDDLIEQLEKATEPDQGFDDIIAEAIGYRKHMGCTGRLYLTWSTPGGKYIGVAPRYTASIDAALMLVPEGWHVKLERFSDGWYCQCWPIDGGTKANDTCRGNQKPAAIALCIAAIKARKLVTAGQSSGK